MTYMGITNINNQFAAYMNFTKPISNININAAQFAGAVTSSDTVEFTIHNASLSGGSVTLSHTVVSGLASAINSDSNLQAINVTAIAVNNIVYVTSNSKLSTTYNAYTSSGSSITATIPGNINARNYAYNNVNEITTIGQTPVNVSLKGLTNTAVSSTNTITPNTGSNPGVFITNQEFTVKAPLSQGNNLTTTTATYGKPLPETTNASAYQIQVTSPSAINPSYDANGNLLNDGVNTYSYDVENRLLSIKEGSGNVSNITYDALGHEAIITESLNGTITSTKQFIWCGNSRCEARDASSNLSNQYFAYGQVNFTNNGTTATNYYYTRDRLGSIREVTDANGNIVSQYNYTVFGQAVVTNGINGQAPSVTSDFGYAGYYFHKPSGLNLTLNRAYSPSLARWLTRDPIGERGGINLYGYVGGDPLNSIDPSGLDMWVTTTLISFNRFPSNMGGLNFHQNLNIGDPYGLFWTFSFGSNYSSRPLDQFEYYPSRISDPIPGKDSYSLKDAFDINQQAQTSIDSTRSVDRYMQSTPEQDNLMINYLSRYGNQAYLNNFGNYNILFNNCRSYANNMFDFASDNFNLEEVSNNINLLNLKYAINETYHKYQACKKRIK